MNRKVVTISVTGVENNMMTQCNWVALAVCDDGTVWQLRDIDAQWTEIAKIPDKDD